jgi:hypothetical protein
MRNIAVRCEVSAGLRDDNREGRWTLPISSLIAFSRQLVLTHLVFFAVQVDDDTVDSVKLGGS